LRVSGDTFVVRQLHAAREERLTFGFNELPHEVHTSFHRSPAPLTSACRPGKS
jgi:hypothetical protein